MDIEVSYVRGGNLFCTFSNQQFFHCPFSFEFSVFFVLEMKSCSDGLKEHVTHCPQDECKQKATSVDNFFKKVFSNFLFFNIECVLLE